MKSFWISLVLGSVVLAAIPAAASTIYRMENAVCIDSNREQIDYGPPPDEPRVDHDYGPGPKLCSNQLTIELRMSDRYDPGTAFYQHSSGVPNEFVEFFSVSDGVYALSTTFPTDYRGWVRGTMPEWAGAGDLAVNWIESWFFRASTDGAWMLGVEFGGSRRGRPCTIGSIEGPYSEGGFCKVSEHYLSVGTFDSWKRVPEPGTLALLGLGLAGIAVTRRSWRVGLIPRV
jgi:hypothetical protein